jgi:hypothetical protein
MQKWKRKKVKDGGVCKVEPLFIEFQHIQTILLVFKHHFRYLKVEEAHHGFDHIGVILCQGGPKRKGAGGSIFMNVVGIVQTIHPVDLAVVFMELIVFQFVGHIDQDKKKAGNPDGQTQYVQKGIVEIFQNISDCYGKKMA